MGEMENDQVEVNSNQQLNQFVTQLEAEVGYSGRTLYQVLSEYLILKSRHPELCWDVEGLEIPHSEQMSLAQFQSNRDLLGRLQDLKDQILLGVESLDSHPWRYFGHPEHQKVEFDTLLRNLRIVSIQLNKFWVELQSCPLFFNSLNHSSLQQVEEILLWIQSSPNWVELNQQSRLIPALVQPASRKTLIDFRRDVKSARVLKDRLRSQLESYSNQADLERSWALVQQYSLQDCLKLDIEKSLQKSHETLKQVRQVLDFISAVHTQAAFPKVQSFQEARHMFKALRMIREIPKEVLPWRRPQILAAGQALRFQTWDERARPIREIRKRLDSHFIIHRTANPETLRDLAEALTAGGPFRRFRSEHKIAERDYLDLLVDPVGLKGGSKETPLEKSQWLLDWASYLEQIKAFENNSDLNSVFGALFEGVDTQFDAALKANTWGNQIRQDLQSNLFGKSIVDFVCSSTDEQFQKLVQLATEAGLSEMERILIELNPKSEIGLGEWIQSEELKYNEIKGFLEILGQVGLREDLKMIAMEDLKLMSEELCFLESQMEGNSDLKVWLKNIYFGTDTDITMIDRGMSYVRFVEEAPIPESMRISFLSLHGPQRFNESKGLIGSVLSSLTPVKEHFQKLKNMTYDQVLPLEQGPILQLITQIHDALKQSSLLESWVEYLKLEKEARSRELGVVLDFFQTKPKSSFRLDLAYEMALDASVLKKKMTGSLFQDISLESISMS